MLDGEDRHTSNFALSSALLEDVVWVYFGINTAYEIKGVLVAECPGVVYI